MAIRIKHIDKTVAGAGGIVVFLRVLLRVGYKQIASMFWIPKGAYPAGMAGSVNPPSVVVNT